MTEHSADEKMNSHAARIVFMPESAFAAREFLADGVRYRYGRSRHWDFVYYPRCDLANCDLCGRLQAKRRLRSGWLPPCNWRAPHANEQYFNGRFCIGCLAKVEAVARRLRDCQDAAALINKIPREARLAQAA